MEQDELHKAEMAVLEAHLHLAILQEQVHGSARAANRVALCRENVWAEAEARRVRRRDAK